jgi:hypothetical protein
MENIRDSIGSLYLKRQRLTKSYELLVNIFRINYILSFLLIPAAILFLMIPFLVITRLSIKSLNKKMIKTLVFKDGLRNVEEFIKILPPELLYPLLKKMLKKQLNTFYLSSDWTRIITHDSKDDNTNFDFLSLMYNYSCERAFSFTSSHGINILLYDQGISQFRFYTDFRKKLVLELRKNHPDWTNQDISKHIATLVYVEFKGSNLMFIPQPNEIQKILQNAEKIKFRVS